MSREFLEKVRADREKMSEKIFLMQIKKLITEKKFGNTRVVYDELEGLVESGKIKEMAKCSMRISDAYAKHAVNAALGIDENVENEVSSIRSA